jgi:putative ABC transport system substrate-binding protein
VRVEGDDYGAAFARIVGERAQALHASGVFLRGHEGRIRDLAAKQRVPTIYEWRESVTAGGLMSYAPPFVVLYRRVAW